MPAFQPSTSVSRKRHANHMTNTLFRIATEFNKSALGVSSEYSIKMIIYIPAHILHAVYKERETKRIPVECLYICMVLLKIQLLTERFLFFH